ncbi:hypothetical protein IV38_GL001760 [Lactobacillus selangorensis]|uniref:Bacterial bifunctional deaminase-reductase C-terminal domain-containing protein n=1 Tax=Lactobacillus selangorensis TaxID=81857 RepID=A0A0R2FH19_9LACO|nr:dihydrofolate reductase family protein [Lactobacillus selangorensis]KRN27921.1 hypothetical protein IV38_GL001760 [Lactobacillus selangorensis]KRN30608.1 hypothetical protein IV40_GL001795 [Lactobacillus selangorensis]
MTDTHDRKVILYITESLDGFIAEKDGTTTWLSKLNNSEAYEDYQDFYNSIDTVIMGRRTYADRVNKAGNYPYADKKTYVFSTSIEDTDDPSTVISGNVQEFVRRLKHEGGEDIWIVGGADIFTDLLRAHLVDEIIITIAPVLLGDGISLVSTNLDDVPLHLKATKRLGHFAQLTYTLPEKEEE